MGLPEITITFSSLASSAIARSQRGVVALILKDDTGDFDEKVYNSVSDIDSEDWTETNLQHIKDAFLGIPSKVIVERLDANASDYSDALDILASKRWNYLAVPGIITADATTVATWIKTQRSTNKKTFKAVLPAGTTDHDDEGIIEFATSGIKVGNSTYTASQYTARIAGILAGLPLTRSATYFVLSEVDAITESTTPDDDIDDGKLILINDGEKVKIGRGVNSLQTITSPKNVDWKKIKIIESHDLIQDDITNTFNDQYVGKVNNDYDNQAIFIAAINLYLSKLQGDVLDPYGTNTVNVDVVAQRAAWEAAGTDTSTWSDQTVKETAYKSNVFLGGNVKFLDAMEDLVMAITA